MSEAWLHTTLSEVAEVTIGRQRSPKTATGNYMTSYLRSANVKDGQLDLTDVLQMNFNPDEQRVFALAPGDVLVSEGSASKTQVGSSAVWQGEMAGVVGFQNTLLRLRAKPEATDSGFLAAWASHAYRSGEFARVAGGSSILHIGSERAKAMRVMWPMLGEQRRIADLIGAINALIEALSREASAARETYLNLLLSAIHGFPGRDIPSPTRLGDVLSLDQDRVAVEGDTKYNIAGVLSAGRGMIDRGPLAATETGYTTLNRLRAGQLVMRKLTAWEGPICVVPQRYDSFYASNEFPTFTPDPQNLSSAYLAHVCRWPGLWHQMQERVTGTVQRRKRLNPDQLLDVSVPLPSRADQQALTRLLDEAYEIPMRAEDEATAARAVRIALSDALLSGEYTIPNSYDAMLDKVF